MQEKLAVKAPVIVEKPFAEEPVQLKIPVNKKYICRSQYIMSHTDPKPKIEKIVEVLDKVRS